MGFFDKLLNGLAYVANESAKKVDKMSDSEIKQKFPDKSVEEVREFASNAHDLHEKGSNSHNDD